MSCFELEFACLIPKSKPEEEISETPLVSYKGTEYKKTVRLNFPSWKPIKSRLRRFWNWLGFVWFHSRSRKCRKVTFFFILTILLLFFMIVGVFVPLIFKCSTAFRQRVIFSPVVATHESFNEVIKLHKSYDSKTFIKPDNFYVTVDSTRNSRVGAWSLTEYGKGNSGSYNGRTSTNNYLLLFHDSYGNRRSYLTDYSRLLHIFNIIVFDYRGTYFQTFTWGGFTVRFKRMETRTWMT
uniref:Uncharacterized protein n=1 Tax=Photinus pyralis TaxID=7054 RepID=A0A1Y1LFT6_PHOPY